MRRAYLAGPDVFLPHAAQFAQAKIALCARYGLLGLHPFNPDLDLSLPPEGLWRRIFTDNLALMESADVIIANLTPFRGASADAGTLVELGFCAGRGKPCFGYSNSAEDFAPRARAQMAVVPDGWAVEDFGLPDNLMIAGFLSAPLTRPRVSLPFDALEVFEACLQAASPQLTT